MHSSVTMTNWQKSNLIIVIAKSDVTTVLIRGEPAGQGTGREDHSL